MSKTVRASIAALALFGFIGLCVWFHAEKLQNQISQEVSMRLGSGFNVSGDGRDVTVSGTVRSDAENIKALQKAKSHPGVRRVIDEIDVIPDLQVPGLNLSKGTRGFGYTYQRESKKVTLLGAVPGSSSADVLALAAKKGLGSVLIDTEKASGDPSLAINGWQTYLEKSLRAAKLATSAAVAITPTRFVASYTTDERYLAQKIRSGFTGLGSKADVKVKVVDRVLSKAGLDCQHHFTETLEGEHINFQVASAVLSQDSNALLDKLAGFAKDCPASKILIEGHTDADGDAQSNKTLSRARADAVKAYFASHGVQAARLKSIGYGEERPIAANATPAGKAMNRRIELRVEN